MRKLKKMNSQIEDRMLKGQDVPSKKVNIDDQEEEQMKLFKQK